MNLALLFILFVFAFLTARIPGVNFSIQIAYLTVSAFVELESARAGSVADDHRYVSWLDNRNGHWDSRRETDMAGLSAKSPAR